MDKISIDLKLPYRQFFSIIRLLVLVNVGLLLGTFFCNSLAWEKQNFFISFILRESNLAWENTSATWYSSMLLLFVAILAILCFISDSQSRTKRNDKLLNYGWIIISLIFTFLSLDEIGSIHESLGQLSFFNSLGIQEALLSNTFYLVIGLIGLFMGIFGLIKFKNNKWSITLGIIGIAFFITNPLNERFEWSQVDDSVDLNFYKRNPFFIILEEGTEIFGSLCFIACLFIYLAVKRGTQLSGKNYVTFKYSLPTKSIFYGAVSIISFLLLLNGLIQYQFNNIERMDNGVPENWFPSAAAFITFFLGLYLYHVNKHKPFLIKKVILVFSFLALVISFYFGSNIYSRILDNRTGLSMLPNAALVILFLSIGTTGFLKDKSIWNKMGISIWTLLCAVTLTFFGSFSPNLIFIAYCILHFFFFLNIFKKSKYKPCSINSALSVGG